MYFDENYYLKNSQIEFMIFLGIFYNLKLV